MSKPLIELGRGKRQRPQAEKPQTGEHSRNDPSPAAARAHKIIAECSHVLVRASEERQLLQDMCRIVVDSGGYLVAWVGMVRYDANLTIEPVASAGDHDNYLGSIKLSWGDNEFGRGPAGMAIRTGKPQAVRDVLTNPNFAAWRKQAMARHYGVLASLPLICDGETLGVFGIFAGESTALDTAELELLGELAQDIAYGISALRTRVAQQRAEAELRESELLFQATFDQAAVGIARVDPEGRITLANRRLHEILGFEPGTLPGRTYKELSHPDDANATDAVRADLHAGKIANFTVEKRYLRRDGSPVWVRLTVSLMQGVDALQRYEISVFEDINSDKRAELLLRLEHGVTRSLAEAENASAAMRSVIRAICETEGWECGRFLRVHEEAGELRLEEVWGVPSEAIERFLSYSRGASYKRGVGLAGTVWQTGQTLWIPDVEQDARSLRKALIREVGLRGAIFFPVISEGKTLGVLAFNSRQIREPDERMMRAVGVIGAQIGQFLRRKQAEETLRESETHYRALSELSADWYWEQDAEFRFTEISSHLGEQKQFRREVWLGKTRWELPYVGVGDEDWRAHRTTLEAHRPFRDFVVASPRKDGSLQHISTSGYPVFDGTGKFAGYRGIARDVSERKRAEQLQKLEHTVTVALAEAESASSALKVVIRAICESEGWECGRYLQVDEAGGVLRFSESWSGPDPTLERFIEEKRKAVLRPGVGLAGKVWQSGQPLWSADTINDKRALGSPGMRGAFLFPVMAEGKTIGVLSFNSREVRDPNEPLLFAVAAIGSQVGQFIQRKQAEAVLRESEERFRSLTGISSDVYWEQDTEYRFISQTGTGSERVGNRAFPLLGKKRWEQNYLNMSAEDWTRHITTLDARQPFHDLELCRLDQSGRKIWISVSGAPVFDPSGAFKGYRGVGKDITARRETDEKVRTQALQQRLIAEFGQQALANPELGGLLNQAVELARETLKTDYCSVIEYRPGGQSLIYKAASGWPTEFIGRREVPLRPGSHVEYVLSRREPLVTEDYVREERSSPSRLLEFGVRSGMQVPVFAGTGVFGVMAVHTRHARRFTEDEVNFLQSVANILAVAIERKNAEERLAYLAQFDSLTGLPNRHLFHDRLVHTMAQARRSGHPMAVLFIDLDRFKLVNDTRGHHAGDQLLKEAATRLAQCMRSSDTVGRFGGDEFGAILSDLGKPGDASLVAHKIIDALAQPFVLEGHETFISASIGITLFPTDGEEAAALITNADVAMYRAKEQGRSNYQYFTREMNERALERVRMDAALRRAIERREFMLHYQPKVDLKSGAICGFEALLRWQRPEKGLVPPVEFIPVLEDTGLIIPVGEWVIQEVCAQIQAWQAAGLSVPPVALNLSARQFQQKDLEATVRRSLEATGVSASLIELELTESMLMKDPETATRTLQELKEAGVKLSVDDFGTGYSSLSYLKRFPIDSLKIDRAFIRDVTLDPDDAAITAAIIGLGHSLKLKVIAEGVETEAQLDFLSARDCDQMQGFYFARPLPAVDCTQALVENRRLKRPSRAA